MQAHEARKEPLLVCLRRAATVHDRVAQQLDERIALRVLACAAR